MFSSLIEGLQLILQWPAVLAILGGVVFGVWLGAVPGLSGIVGLVLVLPFTYDLDPVIAFSLLIAILAVTSTGDTLSAVLLGVPGTAAAAATVIDGHPLAQQGQAERALGAAYTCSMLGGVFGGVVLAVSLPIMQPLVLQFGSPEFLMLGVLGLTMVGALSGASILKGLASAAIGLLISMVGYPPASPIPRYWFDQVFLLEGLPTVAVVLGLFAIPEVAGLILTNRSISRVPRAQTGGGGMLQGIREAFQHWWLVIRCSAIGIYIGMLPGIGASVVDWVAYGHTVHSAKDKSRFGKGDIRGVIGPEAANNSVRGGDLIPTVAFGIPGSASMAVLLGALQIHGLNPGRQMLDEKLSLTFSMVWTLIFANILAAGLMMLASRRIARVAFLPAHLIVPGVLVLVFMGAWSEIASLGAWTVLIVVGLVGFWMKGAGWPRPPMLLGFILGPIMESGYRLSTQAYGQWGWLTRPWVIVILVLLVLALAAAVRRYLRSRAPTDAPVAAGEGTGGNIGLSALLAAALALVFAAAAWMALDMRASARAFPMAVAVPAAVLAGVIALGDVRRWRRSGGGLMSGHSLSGRALLFFASLIAVPLVAMVIGQPMTLAVFAGATVLFWGRVPLWQGALYAGVTFAILFLFYGRLLNTSWLPPLLEFMP